MYIYYVFAEILNILNKFIMYFHVFRGFRVAAHAEHPTKCLSLPLSLAQLMIGSIFQRRKELLYVARISKKRAETRKA
jgi:hypothetical protein